MAQQANEKLDDLIEMLGNHENQPRAAPAIFEGRRHPSLFGGNHQNVAQMFLDKFSRI